jgi:hypothetical protein
VDWVHELDLIMSDRADRQALVQRLSSEYQVALLHYLAMSNDPSLRAPGIVINPLLPSMVANAAMRGRVDQLSMPPCTGTSALDYVHASFLASRLPLGRMMNASHSYPAANELDALQSMLGCVDQLSIIPPRTPASAMDRVYASCAVPGLPTSDRIRDATLSHLDEIERNTVLQKYLSPDKNDNKCLYCESDNSVQFWCKRCQSG